MNELIKVFCVFRPVYLTAILVALSSCSIYKQQFDCPPPAGISCASVTEIESMIVETDKGADLLVTPEIEEQKGCFWCGNKKSRSTLNMSNCQNKIWICGQQKPGYMTKGYYLKADNCVQPCQELEPEEFFSVSDQNQARSD